MIAFDTDVFTEILAGDAAYVQRARAIPREEQFVPIVVVEEILRGRLSAIRLAEAGSPALQSSRPTDGWHSPWAISSDCGCSHTRPSPRHDFENGGRKRSVYRHTICESPRSAWLKARRSCPAIAATLKGSPDWMWSSGRACHRAFRRQAPSLRAPPGFGMGIRGGAVFHIRAISSGVRP